VGKRSTSTFERRALDAYATPFEAVPPLIPQLNGIKRYLEPCCGEGELVEHLKALKPSLTCVGMSDVRFGLNALDLTQKDIAKSGAQMIISNPPWERISLHALIWHFCALGVPAWLLFDADWMHTKQAAVLMSMCSHIVSVGRVRWIRDSPYTGKDNASWFRFDGHHQGGTRFYGRQP